jgi:hypothetical protein
MYKKQSPLFSDPNNGAASVPESEISLAGFLLVGLKNGG